MKKETKNTILQITFCGLPPVFMAIAGYGLGLPEPVTNLAAFFIWVWAFVYWMAVIVLARKTYKHVDEKDPVEQKPKLFGIVLIGIFVVVAASASYYVLATIMLIGCVLHLVLVLGLRELYNKRDIVQQPNTSEEG